MNHTFDIRTDVPQNRDSGYVCVNPECTPIYGWSRAQALPCLDQPRRVTEYRTEVMTPGDVTQAILESGATVNIHCMDRPEDIPPETPVGHPAGWFGSGFFACAVLLLALRSRR